MKNHSQLKSTILASRHHQNHKDQYLARLLARDTFERDYFERIGFNELVKLSYENNQLRSHVRESMVDDTTLRRSKTLNWASEKTDGFSSKEIAAK